jgi:hypothetical protein
MNEKLFKREELGRLIFESMIVKIQPYIDKYANTNEKMDLRRLYRTIEYKIYWCFIEKLNINYLELFGCKEKYVAKLLEPIAELEIKKWVAKSIRMRMKNDFK